MGRLFLNGYRDSISSSIRVLILRSILRQIFGLKDRYVFLDRESYIDPDTYRNYKDVIMRFYPQIMRIKFWGLLRRILLLI